MSAITFRPIAVEVAELERDRMVAALSVTGGNRTRAAELIKMPLRTFVSRMKAFGLKQECPAHRGRQTAVRRG